MRRSGRPTQQLIGLFAQQLVGFNLLSKTVHCPSNTCHGLSLPPPAASAVPRPIQPGVAWSHQRYSLNCSVNGATPSRRLTARGGSPAAPAQTASATFGGPVTCSPIRDRSQSSRAENPHYRPVPQSPCEPRIRGSRPHGVGSVLLADLLRWVGRQRPGVTKRFSNRPATAGAQISAGALRQARPGTDNAAGPHPAVVLREVADVDHWPLLVAHVYPDAAEQCWSERTDPVAALQLVEQLIDPFTFLQSRAMMSDSSQRLVLVAERYEYLV
jgi:hypothetical protein